MKGQQDAGLFCLKPPQANTVYYKLHIVASLFLSCRFGSLGWCKAQSDAPWHTFTDCLLRWRQYKLFARLEKVLVHYTQATSKPSPGLAARTWQAPVFYGAMSAEPQSNDPTTRTEHSEGSTHNPLSEWPRSAKRVVGRISGHANPSKVPVRVVPLGPHTS